MKTVAHKVASVSHTVLASVAGVTDPLPAERAPSTPEGYVPSKLGRTLRPQRSQVALAPKVAKELTKAADYTEVFGTAVPSASVVADALDHAHGWSDALQNARAWFEYVREQESLAWRHAQGVVDPVRAQFELRLARDASLAEAYPSTTSFLGAPKARAKKGAATRKKNKDTKAAEAAAAPAPAAPAAAPAVVDAVKSAAVKLLN